MEERVKRNNRKYSDEFKSEAVELGKKVGCSQASKDLGINESLIRLWRRKLENAEAGSGSKKSYTELEREIRQLTKENGYLKEINEVLKKSTAIFSRDHMKGSR